MVVFLAEVSRSNDKTDIHIEGTKELEKTTTTSLQKASTTFTDMNENVSETSDKRSTEANTNKLRNNVESMNDEVLKLTTNSGKKMDDTSTSTEETFRVDLLENNRAENNVSDNEIIPTDNENKKLIDKSSTTTEGTLIINLLENNEVKDRPIKQKSNMREDQVEHDDSRKVQKAQNEILEDIKLRNAMEHSESPITSTTEFSTLRNSIITELHSTIKSIILEDEIHNNILLSESEEEGENSEQLSEEDLVPYFPNQKIEDDHSEAATNTTIQNKNDINDDTEETDNFINQTSSEEHDSFSVSTTTKNLNAFQTDEFINDITSLISTTNLPEITNTLPVKEVSNTTTEESEITEINSGIEVSQTQTFPIKTESTATDVQQSTAFLEETTDDSILITYTSPSSQSQMSQTVPEMTPDIQNHLPLSSDNSASQQNIISSPIINEVKTTSKPNFERSRFADEYQNYQVIQDYMNQNLNTQSEFCMAKPPSASFGRESNINDEKLRADGMNSRIVNPIPLQYSGSFAATSKGFENPFQMGAMESSKASQQLTVNSLTPMCFYGVPNQNTMAFRMPGKFPDVFEFVRFLLSITF